MKKKKSRCIRMYVYAYAYICAGAWRKRAHDVDVMFSRRFGERAGTGQPKAFSLLLHTCIYTIQTLTGNIFIFVFAILIAFVQVSLAHMPDTDLLLARYILINRIWRALYKLLVPAPVALARVRIYTCTCACACSHICICIHVHEFQMQVFYNL